MFYKQITDKESLKIRNDIFIKDVVPILAKKGFIKSPFYTSCFGRTGNNGIYIYDHYCPVKILDLEINRVDHHPLGR